MIILVPEIHILNFPIYYILSFIYKIKTYEMPQIFCKFNRIKLLKLSEYFNWEDCMIIKSEAVKILEEFLSNASALACSTIIKKHNVDLTLKIKQDLQKEFKKLLFFKKLLLFSRKEKIYIINSLRLHFLFNINKSNRLFLYPTIKPLSFINILFDRFNLIIVNIYRFVETGFQFIYGLICNRKIKRKIQYIYDGISPRELSIDRNKITFTWIISDRIIHKKDILFLLPKSAFQMKKYLRDYKNNELLVMRRFDMFTFSSYKALFSCIPEILKICIRILMPAFNFINLMKIKYTINILKWLPILESFSPKVYICNISDIGFENAAIAYFNNIGMRTIMWSYSTFYSARFLMHQRPRAFRFREIALCNIISEILVVWNRHSKEYIEAHPQDSLKVKIISPLMCGDEDVLNFKKESLCRRLNLFYDNKSRYIAIFDLPPISDYKNTVARQPVPNSANYNYIFIRDMYKLLADFQNIVLIYKPKKSLTNRRLLYSDELKKLFKDMRKNQKVIILNHDINPWIPIALADICITMPFTTPTIAALQYGKPALFYDPLNIVRYHDYNKIKGLIIHSFSRLKELIQKFLANPSSFKDIYEKIDISDFMGTEPCTSSSAKFREYLYSLIKT